MNTLFDEELKRVAEALLFASSEPLAAKLLAEICGTDQKNMEALLASLQEEYRERGFQLREIAGGWQFFTRPEYIGFIEKLYRPKVQQLSRASLETLAIIAYRQPVTRGDLEAIRQVNVDGVVHKLLEKKLICEVGRRACPGRPILYGTTDAFLDAFGIASLSELPPPESFAVETETAKNGTESEN